jgi:hypothetical protein
VYITHWILALIDSLPAWVTRCRKPNSRFLSQPEPGRERRQIVSAQRDEEHSRAHEITLDAYAASHRAVRAMKEDGELPGRVKVRSSQYLNNLVEQDHRIRNHLQGRT